MKKLTMLFSLLCLTLALTISANAAEYTIESPDETEYGRATSIEPVATADRGERKNEDVSKNAALIPPAFGSASAYALHTGTPLTPNLTPGYMVGEGAVTDGGNTVAPPDFGSNSFGGTSTPSAGYTDVTADLYYKDGTLGTLKIPAIDLTVKVVQGTDSSSLAKGAGHFTNTSIWAGNVAIAAHNRGVNNYFGEIHTLEMGDIITLTTKLGKRTYAVASVNKISEMDSSLLTPTTENCITLITCVRNERDYRWCIRAVEV